MKVVPKSTVDKALAHYESYDMSVKEIAAMSGVTTRTVERWATKAGIVRELKTAQSMSARYRDYASVSSKQKLNINQRKPVRSAVRFLLLETYPYCMLCGATPEQGVRLEIDHINNDPSDNRMENLQVLCHSCNIGKFHAYRERRRKIAGGYRREAICD